MFRITTIASLAILLLAATDASAAATAGSAREVLPEAIVVEVVGKPTCTRAKKTAPVTLGQTLKSGDRLQCPEKSRLVLVRNDAREFTVAAGKSMTFTTGKASLSREEQERWRKLVRLITPAVKEPRYSFPGVPAERGSLELSPLDPLQPAKFVDRTDMEVVGRVRHDAPVFVFTRHPGAVHYRLRIERLGEVISDHTLTPEELSEPGGYGVLVARPRLTLPANVNLRWQVMVGNGPDKQTRLVPFKSVEARADTVAKPVRGPEAGADAPTPWLRATLLESEGLYADALASYLGVIAKAPNHALSYRMLARCCDDLEKFEVADFMLKRAQALTKPAP